VRAVYAHRIIVFADYTRLWAYGAAGLKWKASHMAWNDIKITEITSTSILGEYWDASREATANFVVNLATGTCEGDT